MRLTIVAVGNRMPAWVTAGYDEYSRRMPPEARISLVEVKPEARPGKPPGESQVRAIMEAEARRIEQAIPQGCQRVVLDERGRGCTTRELASRIEDWRMDGRDAAFIIGGADGTSDGLRKSATWLWSLSALTLPHPLVRVLLVEQLYRAVSIIGGHPYHRA